MKILYITEHNVSTRGGIQQHVRKISEFFHQKHEIVHLDAEKFGSIKLLNKTVPSKKKLAGIIKKIEPEIIHIHGFSSFFVQQALSIAGNFSARVIYTPHYHPFKYHRRPLAAYLFFHLFLKRTLRNVDCLVALSKREKNFFVQYVDEEKIKIIPNGIDVPFQISPKRRPAETRVLFVGRDDENKRLDFLLQNREEFKKMGIHCDVVTDRIPFASDDIFTFYKDLDETALQKLYRKAFAVVIPSKYEAFSIVGLEALAYGTPILISDRVQLKEYLTPEIFAEVFHYDDKEDFLKKLESFLSLPSDLYRKGSEANIRFSKRFAWEKIAAVLEERCYA